MALKYSANLSMLFMEVTFIERLARAVQAGFSVMESFVLPRRSDTDMVWHHKLVRSLYKVQAARNDGTHEKVKPG